MGGGSKQTQSSEPWKPVQPYLQGGLEDIGDLYSSGGFRVDPFQGQRVAGFGDTSQQAQQMTMDRAGQGATMVDQAQGFLSNQMNPQYQSAQLDAVKQNALGSAIPAAASMFSGSGMLSSTPAMEHVSRAAVDAVSPYEYGAFQNAQQRGMSAAGMAPQMEEAGYLPAQMMGGVGGAQDAMRQRQIEGGMQQHYETQGADLTGMQNYVNMLRSIGGMGGQTATVERQNMGLGGLAQILGAGVSMFSDRRLKEDVRRIGETKGGTSLYSYRYLGVPTIQVGVMADEVPHAAHLHPSGFMMVDYGAVK